MPVHIWIVCFLENQNFDLASLECNHQPHHHDHNHHHVIIINNPHLPFRVGSLLFRTSGPSPDLVLAELLYGSDLGLSHSGSRLLFRGDFMEGHSDSIFGFVLFALLTCRVPGFASSLLSGFTGFAKPLWDF